MTTAETANENSQSGVKQAYRRVPLRFDVNGNPYFDSVMSPDSFKVCALGKLPPRHVVPIIFVPGIMGTNLCGNEKAAKPGEPAWRPPNGKMAGLGEWFRRLHQSAADRQRQIGPDRVRVDDSGKVSIPRNLFTLTNDEAKRRGWGEVHFDSYGAILAELESALNDPYVEPELPSDKPKAREVWSVAKTLERVVKEKTINVLTEWNPQGATIQPLGDDEFLRVGDYYYPVWAAGYNWLASNEASADQLIKRINEAVAYYQKGSYWISTGKVIIVTHSMGGLVTRRAVQKLSGAASKVASGSGNDSTEPSQDKPNSAGDNSSTDAYGEHPEESRPSTSSASESGGPSGNSSAANSSSAQSSCAGPDTVLGVVHGVQPVGGAPVVYRRFRAGCEVNGSFNIEGAMVAVVMGWSAGDIVCVMGSSPGPLELLPTKHVTPGWLKFSRKGYGGKVDAMNPLPESDPYEEIYSKTVKDVWWGMVDEKLLNPAGLDKDSGKSDFQRYLDCLRAARNFHNTLQLYCHPVTYAYYGADPQHVTFGEIGWTTKDEIGVEFEWGLKNLVSTDFDSFGKSRLEFGNQKATFKIDEAPAPPKVGAAITDNTFSGDGTVPFYSGNMIMDCEPKPIVFRMTGFDHQMSYNNESVRQCVTWSIGKIIQLAPPVESGATAKGSA
ncbi:esterase/lipase family protein [Burkholderia pseudomultivorans]|uniref:esterase/lipase family protein n=1 Tax=Burkholderia pseudomultivorans TaxID=1207504 RepID=UPI000AC005FD|nr:hypothetical protein [Burkholderia pseudomultivorans]